MEHCYCAPPYLKNWARYKKFEQDLVKGAKRDPRSFWTYLKTKNANKQSVGPIIQNGKVLTENGDQVVVLNQFFSSVFTKESMNPLSEIGKIYNGERPWREVCFSVEKIKEKIKNLKTDSGPQDQMGSLPDYSKL